jgi:hypothetical protein
MSAILQESKSEVSISKTAKRILANYVSAMSMYAEPSIHESWIKELSTSPTKTLFPQELVRPIG